jgi:hypothetical protein
MSRAGRFLEVIDIDRKTITYNAHHQAVIEWLPALRLSAEPERLSETQARFTLRYRAELRPDTHRIRFWGALWNITSAIADFRKSLVVIECDFSEMIEATHLGSIARDYAEGLPIIRPPS